MSTTDDSADEKEVARLLKEAARNGNELPTPVDWHFNPENEPTFIQVKEALGAGRVLELLKLLQCQSELAVDDSGEETYGTCKRLGFVFMPQNKDEEYPPDDAPNDYDGDGKNLDVSKVEWECLDCFEAATDEHLDSPDSFWFGTEADAFFGLGDDLVNTINTGSPPGSSAYYGGRGQCLEPDRNVQCGDNSFLAPNLTTVASGFVVRGSVWQMYWSILQKHFLTQEDKDKRGV